MSTGMRLRWGLIATFFTFSRETYDHFYNSARDSWSATWKIQATVQAQQSEQAVKMLQHNCSTRCKPLIGKWANLLSLWNRAHQRMTFLKLETKRHWHVMSFTKKDITHYFRIQTSHNVGPCQLSVNIFLSIKSNYFTFFVDSQLYLSSDRKSVV